MNSNALIAAAVAIALCAPATLAQEHDHNDHADHAGQAAALTDNTSEREHVAPAPPQLQMHDMPPSRMTDMMGMNDRALFGQVLVDQLEWRSSNGKDIQSWDAEAWYGSDYTKLWLKTEGERSGGDIRHAGSELLVDRVFARWWSVQAGVRHESGEGPDRDWLAFGVHGLAPYFLKVEATGYVGGNGRTALQLKTGYDLLLTQRLILRPSLELNLHGKSDAARGIGSGLSDGRFGLRLRYEVRREFAPYAGFSGERLFGKTRDHSRAAGEDPSRMSWVAGVRFWF